MQRVPRRGSVLGLLTPEEMLPQKAHGLRQRWLRGLLVAAAGRWCRYYADCGQAQQPQSNEGARFCCRWVWIWREEAQVRYGRGAEGGAEKQEERAGKVQEGGEGPAAAGSRYVSVVV